MYIYLSFFFYIYIYIFGGEMFDLCCVIDTVTGWIANQRIQRRVEMGSYTSCSVIIQSCACLIGGKWTLSSSKVRGAERERERGKISDPGEFRWRQHILSPSHFRLHFDWLIDWLIGWLTDWLERNCTGWRNGDCGNQTASDSKNERKMRWNQPCNRRKREKERKRKEGRKAAELKAIQW